jgi:hypothetical protein
MYGIKTEKGWLCPQLGAGKFFCFTAKPQYPFRTLKAARAIAEDWLPGVAVTIHKEN